MQSKKRRNSAKKPLGLPSVPFIVRFSRVNEPPCAHRSARLFLPPRRWTVSSTLTHSNGTPAPFGEIAAQCALGWDHDRMRPKTWQGVVGRASLKNPRLGFELRRPWARDYLRSG